MIQHRAKDPDDDLELVIVQSMWLTGFDSPPLHTMYVDKPMRGAALMQALARVNRTFRNKQDGLLVGYAPLTENLYAALAEYTARDQNTKPLGRDIDDAIAKVQDLLAVIGDEILGGYDWRAPRAGKVAEGVPERGPRRGELPARPGDPRQPGRRTASRPSASGSARRPRSSRGCTPSAPRSGTLRDLRDDIAFFEEVRVWMAKFDAEERRARGETVPPDVELYLRSAHRRGDRGRRRHRHLRGRRDRPPGPVAPGRRVHRADAGAAQPAPGHRGAAPAVEQEMRKVTRHNIVRQQSFSDRLARADDAVHQPEPDRGPDHRRTGRDGQGGLRGRQPRASSSAPPLSSDELAFYDAVAQNESAVTEMGDGVLADIARDLVRVAAPRRHHRLGVPRRRPRQDPLHDQAAARQARLPAGRSARRDRASSPPDGDLRRGMVARRQPLAG